MRNGKQWLFVIDHSGNPRSLYPKTCQNFKRNIRYQDKLATKCLASSHLVDLSRAINAAKYIPVFGSLLEISYWRFFFENMNISVGIIYYHNFLSPIQVNRELVEIMSHGIFYVINNKSFKFSFLIALKFNFLEKMKLT